MIIRERLRRAWGWILAKLHGARAYRYAGEQEAHEQQFRETQVALSMMTSAPTDDPDQIRMASDFEHGAENRLEVLRSKPRLSISEKRERDAIQLAIGERRRAMDPAAAPEAPRGLFGAVPARMGFLGAIPALGGLQLWVGAAAAAGLVVMLGWWRIEVAMLKHARDVGCTRTELQGETTRRPCVDLASVQNDLAVRSQELEIAQQTVSNARAAASASRDALELANRRASAAAARERRRQSELRQIDAGGPPPNWEHSLRDDGLPGPAPVAGGGAASGGDRP